MRSLYILLVVLSILLLGTLNVYGSKSFEIDVTATVYKIIDGDTFDAFPVGRVRLADVNAPELDEAGGNEAKEALSNLLHNVKVYLDVDDKYVMDRYNRLICVVYIRVNKDRLMNVNKWMLENNYVTLADFDNEFNPSTWSLYEYYPEQAGGESVSTILISTTKLLTSTVTATITETYVKEVTIHNISTRTHTVTSTLSKSSILEDTQRTFVLALFSLIIVVCIILVVLVLRKRR